MEPERWREIERLCQAALEMEPEKREAYLKEACAGDECLRKEVEALLEQQAEAEGFLKDPALEDAAKALAKEQEHVLARELIGRTISHYRIVEKIGQGGMGEVFLADDTSLHRKVALKFLSLELQQDPAAHNRFLREARSAAALDNPHICGIHEVGQFEGKDFIVMEYVAGKTLDDLIPRKGMRLSLALNYAVQIADAVSRAHGAGIIHRDLKPSNVMVDEHGLVKVLDFGLAKLTETLGPEAETTATGTGEGTILGTAAYMSPEQAEGREVDPRSDIFSFGSLLYEMLTGQRAFRGDTRASTIASILREEPKPVSGIAPTIPADLEKLITRCLRKDPHRRWQNMSDLKVALQELKEDSDSGRLQAAPVQRRQFTLLMLLFFAVSVIALVAAGWYWLWRQRLTEQEAPLTVVPLTSYPGKESSPSFSPDGNQVAFSWNGEKEDNYDIYVKLINSPKPLRLTTDPAWDGNPAFSPDGSSIAFTRVLEDRAVIILVPAISGPERLLAEFNTKNTLSLSWFPDGKWIVTDGLALISVETGEIRKLTGLPTESYQDFTPAVSPDGRVVAFSRGAGVSEINLLTLTPDLKLTGEPKQLTHLNQESVQPAWTGDGRDIVFTFAQDWVQSLLRVSASGSVGPKPLFVGADKDHSPAISRQGNRLAFTRYVSDRNIYRLLLPQSGVQGRPPVPFLHSSRDELNPKYSPDGKRIAFESNRTGSHGVWISDADGSNPVEVFSQRGTSAGGNRWSPDGQRLAIDSALEGTWAVYVVRASGGKPVRLTYGPEGDECGSWSHDGKWIYFTSERSGQDEIWKVPTEGGKAVQVTANGGRWPIESQDGKSLYFLRGQELWRIPVGGGVGSQILPSVSFCNFEVMGDGIYFIPEPDKSGKAELRFLSFATNTVKTITALPGKITFGLAVSPDRRWVLYATSDVSGSDLMLVENFR